MNFIHSCEKEKESEREVGATKAVGVPIWVEVLIYWSVRCDK